MSDEVAIGFSKVDDQHYCMHKHGKPEMVQEWLSRTSQSYRDAGYDKEANDLAMVVGKFDIEDLNKVIQITGYIINFVRRLDIDPFQNCPSID